MEPSQLHSAEYFGRQRDFWWNRDFLNLMGQRWKLAQRYRILDVGCGIGHWGRALSPELPPHAQITGVDLEPIWIDRAKSLSQHPTQRFEFVAGDAGRLPFADSSFDMVTCQTVLIHMSKPQEILQEWLRVLKPGGLIALAEPNNLAANMVQSSLSFFESVSDQVETLRFAITCERGKWNLGEGHNSIGDLIPGYLAGYGLENIQTYISDKAMPMVPPYDTEVEKEILAQSKRWAEMDFGVWNKTDTLRYFLAGGGDEKDFDTFWHQLIKNRHAESIVIEEGRYHSAGGALVYLVSAEKPRD